VASKTTYSDADKAAAYVVLTANDGNLKRTARETQLPESTLRRWRDEWAKNGPPQLEEVQEALATFVDEAQRVRGLALDVIEKKLLLLQQNPKDVNVAQVTTLIGILTDKIDRAAGLDKGSRVDHFHHLPAPDELRALMAEYVSEGVVKAAGRDEEIVDAEIVEQAALPAGK